MYEELRNGAAGDTPPSPDAPSTLFFFSNNPSHWRHFRLLSQRLLQPTNRKKKKERKKEREREKERLGAYFP
jgi:hypothetical protein